MSHDSPAPTRPDISALGKVAAIIRRIIGVPDYEIYLEHMHRCHPDQAPVSKREFEQQRLDARYNTPGSRCC